MVHAGERGGESDRRMSAKEADFPLDLHQLFSTHDGHQEATTKITQRRTTPGQEAAYLFPVSHDQRLSLRDACRRELPLLLYADR
jgi:hypothetical protein